MPNDKKASTSDALAAVLRAQQLLGRTGGELVDPATAPRRVVSSGGVRPALETFAQAATIEDLDAQRVDLKRLMREILDWANKPGETTRANGNVVKTVVKVLRAHDENGNSLYPQGVEMLGFAAAAAPLIQPDRLARIIAEAPNVATAYAPDRYTLRFYRALKTVLEPYNEQRREQLLTTLWHTAHEGRFWDVTAGVTEVVDNRQRRAAQDVEARAAANRAVEEILDGAVRGTDEAHRIIANALFDERLPYNDLTVGLVKELPPTTELRDRLAQSSIAVRKGSAVYPDQMVLLSHIPWARPDERPESPIAWLVRQLSSALTPDPDGEGEDAEPLLKKLPEKPKAFAELFPRDVVVGFPHPPAARKLEGKELPGAPGVMVEVVKNSAELQANREYMGNCTWMYKDQMEAGGYILFKLWFQGQCYNAALAAPGNGGWQVREVNSRFNGGNVPQMMRDAVQALAQQMPDRQNAKDGPKARSRQLRMVD